MQPRVLLLITLLYSAPALAQTVPGFSGVFLRTPTESHGRNSEPEDPLVLNIKQGVDTLQVTEMQNGAQATNVYTLNGKPTINVSPDGVRSKDRVKVKGSKLLIKSEVERPGLFVPSLLTTEEEDETWELAPDMQSLTIWGNVGKDALFGAQNLRGVETYTRQTSLPVALEKAEKASGMNKCNAARPPMTGLPPSILSDGVDLGYTAFQQLAWQVSFLAGLHGEFFHDVRRTNASGTLKFYKKGKLLTTYTGSLVLEITPSVSPHPRWELSTPQVFRGTVPLPKWLQALRFRIKWVGPESRDLGEVPSEPGDQPWPELTMPEKWYRLNIPAQDVPLADSLEIHILSAAGKQLGCISGHI